VKLLLDTHALLWWLEDAPALSVKARDIISKPATMVMVSTASIWEVAIKAGLGRLDVPDDLEGFFTEQLSLNDFQILPIHLRHAASVRTLGDHHRDPFDRLLVAQAKSENIPLLTKDQWLQAYEVEVIW